jgi:hypothetical protein
MLIIDEIINAIFFIDILLNFRTSFYNSRGEEIYSPKLIAKDYVLSSRFIIDVLSFIPFGRFAYTRGNGLRIFGILKIQRFARFNDIL